MLQGNGRKPAVSVAISYLSSVLGVRVADERPRESLTSRWPAELVVVKRVGGVKRNLVTDAPWLFVECFANDDQAAEELCMRVADAAEGAPGAFVVYQDSSDVSCEAWIVDHSEIGAPASNPEGDARIDRGCWTLTFEWGISTNV